MGLGGSAVPMLQQPLHQLLADYYLLAAHFHLVLKLCKLGAEVLRKRGMGDRVARQQAACK